MGVGCDFEKMAVDDSPSMCHKTESFLTVSVRTLPNYDFNLKLRYEVSRGSDAMMSVWFYANYQIHMYLQC